MVATVAQIQNIDTAAIYNQIADQITQQRPQLALALIDQHDALMADCWLELLAKAVKEYADNVAENLVRKVQALFEYAGDLRCNTSDDGVIKACRTLREKTALEFAALDRRDQEAKLRSYTKIMQVLATICGT